MPVGYSGTPLAKKLGFKAGGPLWASGMPASVKAELDAQAQPRYLARPTKALAAAHIFHTRAAKLRADIETLRGKLAPDGMIWVSWPKRAARVESDITEDAIRAIALPMGFVDVKVCAVDETWSGPKLVIGKALRSTLGPPAASPTCFPPFHGGGVASEARDEGAGGPLFPLSHRASRTDSSPASGGAKSRRGRRRSKQGRSKHGCVCWTRATSI